MEGIRIFCENTSSYEKVSIGTTLRSLYDSMSQELQLLDEPVLAALVDNKLKSLKVMGGCSGNLQGISKLVEGQEATHIIELLKGNTCGPRDTSCADQLSRALEEALVAQNA